MTLSLKIELPRGTDHFWRVMREMSANGFTIDDIWKASNGVTRDGVRRYILGCQREGHIAVISTKPNRANTKSNVFKVRTRSAKAPVIRNVGASYSKGDIRRNIWTAMRSLPTFKLRELAAAASTDDVPVSLATAQRYVHQLRSAGAVICVEDAGKSGASSYRLKPSANTGPEPLAIHAATFVYDPNKGRVIGSAKAAEVSA